MSEQEVIEWLNTQSLATRIRVITPTLVNEGSTYKDLHIVTKKVTDSLRKEVHSNQAGTLKPRFDNAMLFDALSYQLEHKAIPVEVFRYVQDLHNKDADWMRVAKHTKLKESDRTSVAKEISKCAFSSVEIVDGKGLSVDKAIRKLETPTEQIRTISKYITLSDRVDMIEAGYAKLTQEFNTLKTEQALTNYRLENLENTLNECPNKVLARRMKLENKTNQEIAIALGISLSSVKRLLKTMKVSETK
jgi:uncharacterized protein YerC